MLPDEVADLEDDRRAHRGRERSVAAANQRRDEPWAAAKAALHPDVVLKQSTNRVVARRDLRLDQHHRARTSRATDQEGQQVDLAYDQ